MIKTYSEALDKIFDFEVTKDYSLYRVREGANLLGTPQDSYKTIHITGTNGKGSVSKMIYQVLREAGYKVGIFTSPHLVDIRERFEVDGELIKEDEFVDILNKLLATGKKYTYFENCTLIAYEYFRQKGCDYAVIEVGIGGLHDSTNIITPEVSCITNISLDHYTLFANNLGEIAYQKSGIIKPGVPVISGIENKIIEDTAKAKGSEFIYSDNLKDTNLLGKHQRKNAGIAYDVCKKLGIDDEVIKKGLINVKHRGRIDYIKSNLFVDGAHNKAGYGVLKDYIDSISSGYDKVNYSISIKKGKSIDDMIDIFGKGIKYNIVDYNLNIMLENVDNIKNMFENEKIDYTIKDKEQILKESLENKNELFVVFGSLYMIGIFY